MPNPCDLRQPLWGAFVIVSLACDVPHSGPPIWVTIPEDATLEVIAESLAVNDVVPSARSFKWYAEWSGSADALQAGVYDFEGPLSLAGVAEILKAGVAPLDTMYIPAGVTLAEAAPLLQRQLGIAPTRFWSAVSDRGLRTALRTRGRTIEGYLFPGVYRVRSGEPIRDLLAAATNEFERFWTDARRARLDTLGFARDEIMTLASIVEGEVRYDFERPIVSSVYHNRLAAGMRLQADPTVIYALGERRRLFYRDYAVKSPFNTYLINGLPPHPINQPSAASIDAALYPDSTDFLYFVAGPDGKHHFSSSYADHVKTIQDLRSP